MAKSIYEIVADMEAEITHNGATCFITLPNWWCELGEVVLNQNDDDLAYFVPSMSNDALRAVMQAGLAKLLIELRAVARPADYTAKEGGGKRELNEEDSNGKLPQTRVNAYALKPYKKPGEAKEIKAKDVDAALAKLSPEELATLLAKYQK